MPRRSSRRRVQNPEQATNNNICRQRQSTTKLTDTLENKLTNNFDSDTKQVAEPSSVSKGMTLNQEAPASKLQVKNLAKTSTQLLLTAQNLSVMSSKPSAFRLLDTKIQTVDKEAVGDQPETQVSPASQKTRDNMEDLLTPQRRSTPETQTPTRQDSSSELSSAPTTLGSSPEDLTSRQARRSARNLRDGSPPRRSERTRKRSIKATEAEVIPQISKKRKIVERSATEVPSVVDESSETSPAAQETILKTTLPAIQTAKSDAQGCKRKVEDISQDVSDMGRNDIPNNKKPRTEDGPETEITRELNAPSKLKVQPKPQTKKLSKAEQAKEKLFYAELAKELTAHQAKDRTIWSKFSRSKVIMYGADAQTEYTPAYAAITTETVTMSAESGIPNTSLATATAAKTTTTTATTASTTPTESGRRGGRNNGKGASRSTRGGGSGNNGKSRGGKGRGRGRDEESPNPSLPKRIQTQEDASIIKYAKARQAELRKFFNILGGHQVEILDSISSRDLNRLAKKPKAHRQVPEYDEVLKTLNNQRRAVEEENDQRFRIASDTEVRRYEAEKAAIEARCETQIKDLHEEYRRGAQGDLIIFRRALTAAHDETRTQDGSEADYFPQYHELPEADGSVRGYAATRVTDEKPFKHHLRTYDDEARREVIDDDIGPIIQAFAHKNAERRAEEAREKTRTLEALSQEAERQLKEIKGYLIPRPLWREEEVNSYALSHLADVADWMARQHPNKQYIYMPLESGETFPSEALNYDRLPGQSARVLSPPPPPPPQVERPRSVQRNSNNKPTATAQPTRRSLRNIQPSAPNPPLTQSSTPSNTASAPQTPIAAAGPGPALAPAPPKRASAPVAMPASVLPQAQPPRPPPIDTRSHLPTPPNQSPIQPPPHQSSHGLPPIQPRHLPQGALQPPPPPPQYSYPQAHSPTHPPPHPYPPPHHAGPAPPYPMASQMSPYHQQPPMPPSPYGPPAQSPYRQYGAPAPPFPYPVPHNQMYSFMPPQQGPPPPLTSPTSRNEPPPGIPLQASHPHHESYNPYNQNGYHNRTPSYPHPAPSPIPLSTYTISYSKGRSKAKSKQPVTFVNQTLATRKAAAEQLAKEAEEAAVVKKEKERARTKEDGVNGKKSTQKS